MERPSRVASATYLLAATILATSAVPAFAQAQPPVPPTPPGPAPQGDVTQNISNAAPPTTRRSSSPAIRAQPRRARPTPSANRSASPTRSSPRTSASSPTPTSPRSFNRIPGITITREITGEGLNVAIRGLGTNFTRVLLNGAPVAIASTGRTDAQNTNREVDLDLFPTELFTQLTVNKSPTADMLEGGAAGTVNMRSARPFDNPGDAPHLLGAGDQEQQCRRLGLSRLAARRARPSDNFGVLVGVAGVRNKVADHRLRDDRLDQPQPVSAAQMRSPRSDRCNATGGGNWTIPGTVPANAGNGLTTGATIDQAFLLAHNPGATIQQIDNGIIPRLGRPSDEFGTQRPLQRHRSASNTGRATRCTSTSIRCTAGRRTTCSAST